MAKVGEVATQSTRFTFNLDDNSSEEAFDKPRSRTKSFSSSWEKRRGASVSTTASSTSVSTLEESSSLVAQSIGMSSQCATRRRAESRSGYLRLPDYSC